MTAIFRSVSEATRILIVREPSAVELGISDRLVSIGYGVTVAEGADSALALLRDDPGTFDIVISEVSHDASVGLNFLGWLKSDPQLWNKPVIMLTGGEPDKDHTALLNAGAHFCLNHGVDDKILCSAVCASVIDGKRTNRIREEVRDRRSDASWPERSKSKPWTKRNSSRRCCRSRVRIRNRRRSGCRTNSTICSRNSGG